jgi:uncharacterized protein involved in response to NO
MELFPTAMMPLMYGAAIAWIVAFAGFVIVYGWMLTGPNRAQGGR